MRNAYFRAPFRYDPPPLCRGLRRVTVLSGPDGIQKGNRVADAGRPQIEEMTSAGPGFAGSAGGTSTGISLGGKDPAVFVRNVDAQRRSRRTMVIQAIDVDRMSYATISSFT